VSIAAPKEEFGDLRCNPPHRDRPHSESILNEDTGGVQPLWRCRRQIEGWPVVLDLAWIRFGFW
jgi:hypothetical protein